MSDSTLVLTVDPLDPGESGKALAYLHPTASIRLGLCSGDLVRIVGRGTSLLARVGLTRRGPSEPERVSLDEALCHAGNIARGDQVSIQALRAPSQLERIQLVHEEGLSAAETGAALDFVRRNRLPAGPGSVFWVASGSRLVRLHVTETTPEAGGVVGPRTAIVAHGPSTASSMARLAHVLASRRRLDREVRALRDAHGRLLAEVSRLRTDASSRRRDVADARSRMEALGADIARLSDELARLGEDPPKAALGATAGSKPRGAHEGAPQDTGAAATELERANRGLREEIARQRRALELLERRRVEGRRA